MTSRSTFRSRKNSSTLVARRRFSLTALAALLCALTALILGAGAPARAAVSVLTQHNDKSRTGANLQEAILNTSNVNVNTFGKLFARAVVGDIYAQPLYVPQVAIPGHGVHNVVYVATEHNNVYAFDADDPLQAAPLWQINLGPSAPTPNPYWGNRYGAYHDLNPEIGITSTPVIDPNTGTIYVVAFTEDDSTSPPTWHHRLHALSMTTGHEKLGGPVEITGSVPGVGDAASNGVVTFDPAQHMQRPALLLLNGKVYFACASHADSDPYHGWIFVYNAANLTQAGVFCTTPNGGEGGIWQAGQGLTADSQGNIYLMVGNGTSTVQYGGSDYGEAFLKLNFSAGHFNVADWFMPNNFDWLNIYDVDLGSSGVLGIPGTSLILGGGKQGLLYLLNTNPILGSLGGFNSFSDQVLQEFQATNSEITGSPVYWSGPNGGYVYVWGANDHLKAFKFVHGLLQTTPVTEGADNVPNNMTGGYLSVTANGRTAGSGIVWAAHPYQNNPNTGNYLGMLRAYDGSNLKHQLWNSLMIPTRDDFGDFAKFCEPTIANGKVYMATFSNQLSVYGLLPLPSSPPAAPQTLTATPGNKRVVLRWTPAPGATSYDIYLNKSAGQNPAYYYRMATLVTGNSYTMMGLPNGLNVCFQVRAVNGAGSSGPSPTACAIPATTLPLPWADTDIGNPGQSGSGDFTDGTFTVAGGGSDIWNASDQFNYCYQPLAGDGVIIARVSSLQFTDGWAKAGVMIRSSLDPSSPFVDMVASAGNGMAFQFRSDFGGQCTHIGSWGGAPEWVKLVRTGNQVTGYASTDGVNWGDPFGSTTLPAGPAFIGLAVTAHNDASLNTATFDDVSVTLPSQWSNADIGNPGQAGSGSITDGIFTVAGGGNDIWNASDQFHYYYQALPGDGAIIANVSTQQYTDGWAKAGVMIRSSLDPSSPFVDMVASAGNGMAFQFRSDFGGQCTHIGSWGGAPEWVKLVRTGNQVTGYASTDGVNWGDPFGSTTLPAGPAFIGLAVTAHNDGALNTATFNDVVLALQ